MRWFDKGLAKAFFVPGGVCVAAAVLILNWGLFTLAPSAVHFYYYAVLLSGGLLAWRFHSSKILFALLTVFLSQRALQFFFAGRAASVTGHTTLEAIAVLLPFNFVIFSMARERGVNLSSSLARLCLVFLEATFVAIICRPGETSGPAIFHAALFGKHWQHWTKIPPFGAIFFVMAIAVLLSQFLLRRKPVDSGFLWCLIAVMFAIQAGSFTLTATAYMATAALVLTTSVIENSYVLAYQDELTGLPARRAFNDALLDLKEPYAVAAVDIDHFKSFNDTYGHETGDQVLRMVATSLSRVDGGGTAYRVGGEEFTILFPRKALQEVLPHLENLRWNIQNNIFRVRGTERRMVSHGTDRRKPSTRKNTKPKYILLDMDRELSVTVSIGAAESSSKLRNIENVIRAADKALYAAKSAGRNRVISGNAPRPRPIRASDRSA